MQLIRETRPLLLIGSPMCRMFSRLMAFNMEKIGKEKYQRELLEAIRHLRFVLSLYRLQASEGRSST